MNLNKRIVLSLAGVALLGLTAAGASAQTIAKATFTLPIPAYWNSTLLQPGDYALSMERTPSGVELLRLRGEDLAVAFIVPAGGEETTGHSCLKLDSVNGTNVVRELDASQIGKSYQFAVSKTVRELTMRGAVTQPISVPLSAASGF